MKDEFSTASCESKAVHPNKCKKGDRIIHDGHEMVVSEVISRGTSDVYCKQTKTSLARVRKGNKAVVSACRIMANGQVLTRSPKYIGDKWEHVKG